MNILLGIQLNISFIVITYFFITLRSLRTLLISLVMYHINIAVEIKLNMLNIKFPNMYVAQSNRSMLIYDHCSIRWARGISHSSSSSIISSTEDANDTLLLPPLVLVAAGVVEPLVPESPLLLLHSSGLCNVHALW